MLLRSGVEIIGKKAVVIGRSKIVGLPTSLLLQVLPILYLISCLLNLLRQDELIFHMLGVIACNYWARGIMPQ